MPASTTRRTRHVTKKGRTGPFVKYVGAAAQRTISATAWRSLGIPATEGHEWSAANNYLIESSAFSDAQLDYLLFVEVGPNGAHLHRGQPRRGPRPRADGPLAPCPVPPSCRTSRTRLRRDEPTARHTLVGRRGGLRGLSASSPPRLPVNERNPDGHQEAISGPPQVRQGCAR